MKRIALSILLLLSFLLIFSQTDTMPDKGLLSVADSVEAVSDTIFDAFPLTASDVPDDAGGVIQIRWQTPENARGTVDIFRIEGDSVVSIALELPCTSGQYRDADSPADSHRVLDGTEYIYYAVLKTDDNMIYVSQNSEPVTAGASWFNKSRTNSLVIAILITLTFLWYIRQARMGKELFIRKISGLDAVEEAVGRSTEMGKPIMYILGIGYVTDIPTIAGLTILGRVAKKAADYDTRIMVPSYDPVVMTTAQEVVKEAFTEAGRPDAFRKDDIQYITQDQFGYAAGVDGMMMREKPGAVFLQGLFFAESLILAETGHSIGAIQIAGTTETAQLPFFVAACDYTLIGEEMMAASVYLEREPLMLGSIVAEDFIKFLIILLIIAGLLLGILGPGFNIEFFNKIFEGLIHVL